MTEEAKPLNEHSCDANISETEKWISLAAGGVLALYGLSRKNWSGLALALGGAALLQRGLTQHCHVYDKLGIDTSGHDHADDVLEFAPEEKPRHGFVVEKVVTINKPREELFNFWRDFENLPRFMDHLEQVRVLDQTRSEWTAKAPTGTVSWDAKIVDEVPGELIAWHSSRDSQVHNTGKVTFKDAAGGTEVKVVIQYQPPGGIIGKTVAKLFGEEPQQQVDEDLERFKTLMEAGEIATSGAETA
jgi:uncharacterized membrane protein